MNMQTADWKSAGDELPDADQTVLIHHPKNDEPVWLGFFDGEQWHDVDAMPAEVSHWAPMPEPPAK